MNKQSAQNLNWIYSASFALLVFEVLLRYLLTGTFHYWFLMWNLFLSAVPLFFAIKFKSSFKTKNTFITLILFLFWLLFYPNSAYVFTDYIHLPKYLGESPLLFDILITTSFAIYSLFLGFYSLEIICDTIFKGKKDFMFVFSVFFINLISSIGVFIGRFLRFNSWDLFTSPLTVINQIVDSFRFYNIYLLVFIGLYALFVNVAFLLFSKLKIRTD